MLRALLWDGGRKASPRLVRIEEDLHDSVHMQELSKAATASDGGSCSFDCFCLHGHCQRT